MLLADASIADKGTAQTVEYETTAPLSEVTETTKSGPSTPLLGKRKFALASSLSKSAKTPVVVPPVSYTHLTLPTIYSV